MKPPDEVLADVLEGAADWMLLAAKENPGRYSLQVAITATISSLNSHMQTEVAAKAGEHYKLSYATREEAAAVLMAAARDARARNVAMLDE